ncbi:cilia- and flagella-associated protein 251 isoform X2 [Xenopus laevis]|nr:cilia- and flagella-associated protein 251 isoform X2 [Xenopus laevis]XP_041422591.1 cilia- and flagella-associated protein 251 isoform X2 [Xenopus laevis]XP_041422592.1 cilia- and flagella-associated protein 251 isoform X2 [Xenopus laevis]OCT77200.1 hypothetical protein XELAEV_18032397mg [Xenopus laevis]
MATADDKEEIMKAEVQTRNEQEDENKTRETAQAGEESILATLGQEDSQLTEEAKMKEVHDIDDKVIFNLIDQKESKSGKMTETGGQVPLVLLNQEEIPLKEEEKCNECTEKDLKMKLSIIQDGNESVNMLNKPQEIDEWMLLLQDENKEILEKMSSDHDAMKLPEEKPIQVMVENEQGEEEKEVNVVVNNSEEEMQREEQQSIKNESADLENQDQVMVGEANQNVAKEKEECIMIDMEGQISFVLLHEKEKTVIEKRQNTECSEKDHQIGSSTLQDEAERVDQSNKQPCVVFCNSEEEIQREEQKPINNENANLEKQRQYMVGEANNAAKEKEQEEFIKIEMEEQISFVLLHEKEKTVTEKGQNTECSEKDHQVGSSAVQGEAKNVDESNKEKQVVFCNLEDEKQRESVNNDNSQWNYDLFFWDDKLPTVQQTEGRKKKDGIMIGEANESSAYESGSDEMKELTEMGNKEGSRAIQQGNECINELNDKREGAECAAFKLIESKEIKEQNIEAVSTYLKQEEKDENSLVGEKQINGVQNKLEKNDQVVSTLEKKEREDRQLVNKEARREDKADIVDGKTNIVGQPKDKQIGHASGPVYQSVPPVEPSPSGFFFNRHNRSNITSQQDNDSNTNREELEDEEEETPCCHYLCLQISRLLAWLRGIFRRCFDDPQSESFSGEYY